ncbi:MAG TPA: glycosyltransferase family 2 protein [Thermoanaerobaculia bacterium]
MAQLISDVRPGAAEAAKTQPIDLSILIVTWNSERWIDRCLRSLPLACDGLVYEVLVHDNASSDSTLAIARTHVPDDSSADRVEEPLRLIASETNAGFAGGINRSFHESRGRYVLLLNPDCEPAPEAVTRLYEFLETHPAVAGAAPLLIDDDGTVQREFQLRRLPTLRTLASEVLLLDKVFPTSRAMARHRYRDADLNEAQPIEQPAAAALLLRREVFEEVGPFDEQFSPAWFEDVDYCQRLMKLRRETWVVPASRVGHHGGASLEHMEFAHFAGIWYGNMWRYAKKWLRPAEAETLRWIIVFGMMLRGAAGVAGLRPPGVGRGDAFRAYWQVLTKALTRWK